MAEVGPVGKTGPKPPQPQFRAWASANGKYTVEAVLVGSEKGIAHLKKRDGAAIQVPLTKRSAADRKFVIERDKRE